MTALEKITEIAKSNLPESLKLELIAQLAGEPQPVASPFWVWPYWPIPTYPAPMLPASPWSEPQITWTVCEQTLPFTRPHNSIHPSDAFTTAMPESIQ